MQQLPQSFALKMQQWVPAGKGKGGICLLKIEKAEFTW